MKCKVDIVYSPDMSTKRKQPLFEGRVPAGFPSPAADYEEDKLDLNNHLIKNPVVCKNWSDVKFLGNLIL